MRYQCIDGGLYLQVIVNCSQKELRTKKLVSFRAGKVNTRKTQQTSCGGGSTHLNGGNIFLDGNTIIKVEWGTASWTKN